MNKAKISKAIGVILAVLVLVTGAVMAEGDTNGERGSLVPPAAVEQV